jgi:hypothetical protein
LGNIGNGRAARHHTGEGYCIRLFIRANSPRKPFFFGNPQCRFPVFSSAVCTLYLLAILLNSARHPRFCPKKCALKVWDARYEPNHDRRWHLPVEEKRGRVLRCRRRSLGDCILLSRVSQPQLTLMRFKETDKATIDVEAQEDGILAKIIVCALVYSTTVFNSLYRKVTAPRMSRSVHPSPFLPRKATTSLVQTLSLRKPSLRSPPSLKSLPRRRNLSLLPSPSPNPQRRLSSPTRTQNLVSPRVTESLLPQ